MFRARFLLVCALVATILGICHFAPTARAQEGNALGDISATLANVANAPQRQGAETPVAPGGPRAVVRAIMFTRVGCEHCYEAKREILPPIHEMFGDQLDLRYVYNDTQMGKMIWEIALLHYAIEDPGVPMIIVGDQRFQGTNAIRDLFPAAVFAGISQGGIDWPDLPGLEYAIAEAGEPTEVPPSPIPEATETPKPTDTAPPTSTIGPTDTPVPPSPTPTPQPGPLGGCFSSIALGLVALGTVVAPRARGVVSRQRP